MADTIFVSRLLASGGDARIKVPAGHNTNQYGSSPFPRSTLAYAASTANDISLPAFRHLGQAVEGWPAGAVADPGFYGEALENLRHRLRNAYKIGAETEVVYAPSGTDLEYVALALAGPDTTNLVVGADEVGSGCILAAEGRYFANETAIAAKVRKGAEVAGFAGARMVHVPVRNVAGRPQSSGDIATRIGDVAGAEATAGRTCLAHVVYGSKTGLILPDLGDLDRLRRRYPSLRFVVDACQARISRGEIRDLLDRDCIVLLTGSKFMGGPPFCGMALIPQASRPRGPLPSGFGEIFRREEWPLAWRECDFLPGGTNPGLLLRLTAAQFELERFQAIAADDKDRVIVAFGNAVRNLAAQIGARLVEPCLTPGALCTATLATLDLSVLPSAPDFATAQRWHRVLAARGLRLGQPVKCVRMADGGWGGTLRISLSMPLIVELSALAGAELSHRFDRDMTRIATVIEAATRSVVA